MNQNSVTSHDCDIEKSSHIKTKTEKKTEDIAKAKEFVKNMETFDASGISISSPAIAIIGKRDTGKTELACDLISKLHNKYDYNMCYIVSPVSKLRHCVYKRTGITDIVYYDMDKLKNVIEHQKYMFSIDKEHNTIIVLDDCIHSKQNDEHLFEILASGRHLKITIICMMQYPLGLSPDMRCNFDYVYWLGDAIMSTKKRMWDHYFGMIDTFNEFNYINDNVCVGYNTLVSIVGGMSGEKRLKKILKQYECSMLPTNENKAIMIEPYVPTLPVPTLPVPTINEKNITHQVINQSNNTKDFVVNYDSDSDSEYELDSIESDSLDLKKNNGGVSSDIAIGRFDIDKLCEYPSCVIIDDIADRAVNFTRNIIDAMAKNHKYRKYHIYSENKLFNNYENADREIKVFTEFNEHTLKHLLDEQQQYKNDQKYGSLVVLDNLSIETLNSNSMYKELLYNSRHHGITLLVISRDCYFSPELRHNFDYIFVAQTDDISEQEKIYDYYFGIFPTIDSFKNVYDQITNNDDYMLCINRYGSTNHLIDKIKYCSSKFNVNDSTSVNQSIESTISHKSTNLTNNLLQTEILSNIAKCNYNLLQHIPNIKNNEKSLKLVNLISTCNLALSEAITKDNL